MIKTCIKRPEFFRAVQFTGDNFNEIKECNFNKYLMAPLEVSEWVVVDKHGCIETLSDYRFRETYEEVRDEH
jgi:hypothetical protein